MDNVQIMPLQAPPLVDLVVSAPAAECMVVQRALYLLRPEFRTPKAHLLMNAMTFHAVKQTRGNKNARQKVIVNTQSSAVAWRTKDAYLTAKKECRLINAYNEHSISCLMGSCSELSTQEIFTVDMDFINLMFTLTVAS